MEASALRAWCLEQAGASEEFPFGPEHSVFKVAGKMFALSALNRTPLEVSVKCEPDLALQLRQLPRNPARLSPQQAPLEHAYAGWQPARPARARPDRRLVRPRGERAARPRARPSRLGARRG